MTARQLSFDLPVREARGREDFFVSPANAEAVAQIEGWREWPGRKLVLTGAPGSGKTHLAHVWSALAEARIVAARDLADREIGALTDRPVAVEDVSAIAGDHAAEAALFHLHNMALAEGQSLLLTADTAPPAWQLSLPDLASRVAATPVARLQDPDDDLLAAVIMKLLADRQLVPTPGTIPYLVRRIDRSFAAAGRVVAQLDATALETGRPVSRALAARVLDNPGA
ncbi:P-loop NTPase family protein [Roseovarius salinarum]|uniref:DnaA ATPase domain-containing protein n=1 Tax=Roseovarius salinarum TaxID=1981892 RepID=UPI000C32CFC4|nr:DnaA/Hda family protein [Roseovarius salinarum]